jgi:hypothetical protein
MDLDMIGYALWDDEEVLCLLELNVKFLVNVAELSSF